MNKIDDFEFRKKRRRMKRHNRIRKRRENYYLIGWVIVTAIVCIALF